MRFTGRRFVAALLLVAFAVFCLVIWQRDAVLQWALQHVLAMTPDAQPTLSGLRFDLQQARLSDLQFKVQTGNGPLALQLQGVQADYPSAKRVVHTIRAEKARLRFDYVPTPAAMAGSDAAALTMPILPIQHVAVDECELEIQTTQGLVRFNGRAELKVDANQVWLLTLQEGDAVTQAKLTPDLQDLRLSVQRASGLTVWELQLARNEQRHWQGMLAGDVSALLSWFKQTELVPANLRQDMGASLGMADNLNLAGMQIKLDARSKDNLQTISGRLLLTRQQIYLASAEIAIKPDKGAINFDSHLDLPAAEFFALLKPWTPDVISAWQFPAGNIMGTVRLDVQPKQPLKGDAYIRAHHLALVAGPARMADGYLNLELKTIFPLALSVELDAPTLLLGKETSISQLQLKASLKNNTLSLEKATMPMMGGMLDVLPANINLEQRPVLLTLGVRHLDLAKLLASLNYPELSGTGDISGKLPLRLSLESVEVVDGKLHANRAGVLRYRGPQATGENMALKALGNLRYEKLQATLNYRPSGDYQVGLRVEGNNPQVFSGYPLAFNLNLHGHLPDLLQKGIMAGDFEKPILEQVQNGNP